MSPVRPGRIGAPRFHALDGTASYSPPGQLIHDPDEGKVQCALCGRWFVALPSHLRVHGLSADDYRAVFGLNATRPLQAADLSHRQGALMRRRVRDDKRISEGMAEGLRLARAGELNRLGRDADRSRGRSLERRERTRRQGAALGAARAREHERRREQRARELGYKDLADFLRRCYVGGRATVAELAAGLGAHESAVIADMNRLGAGRRSQPERLAEGRARLAAQRAARRAAIHARVAALGFDSIGAYLRDRLQARGRQRPDVAAELGLTGPALARLMSREQVKGRRDSRPADATAREGYGARRLAAARSALAARQAARNRELAAAHGHTSLVELYREWRADGLSDRAIADRLHVGEKLVRRLRRRAAAAED